MKCMVGLSITCSAACGFLPILTVSRCVEGAADLPNEKPDIRRIKAAAQIGPDGNGRQRIQNHILLALPHNVRNAVLAKSQFVHLPIPEVLNEIGAPIQHAYFIESGLSSILNVLQNGKSVEVGLTGREGFVGIPLIA